MEKALGHTQADKMSNGLGYRAYRPITFAVHVYCCTQITLKSTVQA